MSEDLLSFPPFPPLRWEDYFWMGEVNMPFWAGFQSRRGPYASINIPDSSNGIVRVDVTTGDDEPGPPSVEQVQAFRFLMDHEPSIGEMVLRGIFSAYHEMRERYADYLEDADKIMPEIHSPEDLRSLIGLSNIHVLRVASRGQAYVGFEFGCTWDFEHRLGVLTHRGRVIEIGGADTSFLSWIADDDLKKQMDDPEKRLGIE